MPRTSGRRKADAERAARSATRLTPILLGLEAPTAVLRRKRVGPKTQLLYARLVSEFHGQFSITDATPALEIDSCLDLRLDELYLQGELPGPGRLLYYALAWHHCLEHSLLPRSRAARVGHARSSRPKLTDPETWESVLLMSAALLHKRPPDISPIEAAQAATGFLLAFDVYGRAGDIARHSATSCGRPSATSQGSQRFGP